MQTGTPPADDHALHAPQAGVAERNPLGPKAPYAPPELERLGPWEAFTLQQSIPIFP